MKILENKKFKLSENQPETSYMDLVKAVVNYASDKGINASEMRTRLHLLDAVITNEGIQFEDADVSKLKELAEAMPWALVNKEIIAFCDDVNML